MPMQSRLRFNYVINLTAAAEMNVSTRPGGLGDCGAQLTSSLPFTGTPQRHGALSRAELVAVSSFQTAFVLPTCGPEQSHFQRTEKAKWRHEALMLPANLSGFSKNASEKVLWERRAGTSLPFSC